MLHSKKWALLAGVLLASLILAACQPQTIIETQVVRETVVAEVTRQVEIIQTQLVQQTQVVEVEAAPFTKPHPFLGDIRVRKAIAYCTNRPQLIESVYTFVDDPSTLLMDTFIPTSHWAHANEGVEQYPFDVEKGKALLAEAGFTDADGNGFMEDANGNELSLKFTTTSAQFRQTWAAVFEQNMADCGIRVVRLHAPASWWFGDTTGLSRRDFELGAYAWVGEADPGGTSLYACDQIPFPDNGWEGQNTMGWCNEAASKAIYAANNTLDRDERIAQYAIVQQEFAKDMISLPLFNRVEVLATNKDLTGFAPAPGEPYPTYNAHEWELPGSDTLVFGFTQEPASLWPLVESAYVANLAYTLVGGYGISSRNYDFAVNMYYQELPTVDNGGATIETVEVAAGTKVVDITGNVVELGDGVTVKDAEGNEVAFSGSAIPMQQMTVNYKFVDGIKWSDGEPLKAADLELGSKINCDPDSGATVFTTCERTESEEFADTSYTRKLVPGYTPPLYFTLTPSWYPSHRVVADGRTLADVPAAEWATLPEIAENPIDTGPYMVNEWVKGQSISFVANPNFYLGAPKTPNIIIQFVADTNQAVAQLLTGDIDVLFGETLGAGAEVQTVRDAADRGEVAIYIEPSATWEHIDFNLFLP